MLTTISNILLQHIHGIFTKVETFVSHAPTEKQILLNTSSVIYVSRCKETNANTEYGVQPIRLDQNSTQRIWVNIMRNITGYLPWNYYNYIHTIPQSTTLNKLISLAAHEARPIIRTCRTKFICRAILFYQGKLRWHAMFQLRNTMPV
jgi:hypothetical protein